MFSTIINLTIHISSNSTTLSIKMSNFVKKAEDALTGKNHHSSARSANHGPHDSNLANKLDPRVDSDRGMSLSEVEDI